MMDIMFDIPSKEDIVACRITEDTINKKQSPELTMGIAEKKAKKEPKRSA